jgi:hypothetical protein
MEEELSLDANIRLGHDLGLDKNWEYTEFRSFIQEEVTKNFFLNEGDYFNKEKEHLYCAFDYSFMKVKGNVHLCGLNVGTYLYTKLKGGDQYFLYFKEYEFYISIKKYSEEDKLSLWDVCVCEFNKKNNFNKFNRMIERSNNTHFLVKREVITMLNEDNKQRVLNTFNNVFKVKVVPNAVAILNFSKSILHKWALNETESSSESLDQCDDDDFTEDSCEFLNIIDTQQLTPRRVFNKQSAYDFAFNKPVNNRLDDSSGSSSDDYLSLIREVEKDGESFLTREGPGIRFSKNNEKVNLTMVEGYDNAYEDDNYK